MRKTLPGLLILLLLLTACASTGEPEPAADQVDVAGTYTLSTVVQGMDVNGQMRITGEPGAYSGSIYSDLTGELHFTRVDIEGNRGVLVADSPDGPVEFRLVFSGNTITGGWSLGPDGGTVRGRRVNR